MGKKLTKAIVIFLGSMLVIAIILGGIYLSARQKNKQFYETELGPKMAALVDETKKGILDSDLDVVTANIREYMALCHDNNRTCAKYFKKDAIDFFNIVSNFYYESVERAISERKSVTKLTKAFDGDIKRLCTSGKLHDALYEDEELLSPLRDGFIKTIDLVGQTIDSLISNDIEYAYDLSKSMQFSGYTSVSDDQEKRYFYSIDMDNAAKYEAVNRNVSDLYTAYFTENKVKDLKDAYDKKDWAAVVAIGEELKNYPDAYDECKQLIDYATPNSLVNELNEAYKAKDWYEVVSIGEELNTDSYSSYYKKCINKIEYAKEQKASNTSSGVTASNDKDAGKYSWTAVSDEYEKSIIWAAAESAVKSYLKYPKTAKFPFSYNSAGCYIYQSYTAQGKSYIAKGTVEAQNDFGQKIMQNFEVGFTHESGSGETLKIKLYGCNIY